MDSALNRLGAGRDRFGNLYSIGRDDLSIPEGSRVEVHKMNEPETIVLWPTKTRPVSGQSTSDFNASESSELHDDYRLRSLAVTTDQYLVVGMVQPRGLLIFDLQSTGPPIYVVWPEDSAFYPLDIAPRPGGGVYVLDADTDESSTRQPRCWALDRLFRLESLSGQYKSAPSVFKSDVPTGKSGQLVLRRPVPEMALMLPAQMPRAIEVLPDDSVLVLSVSIKGTVTDPESETDTTSIYQTQITRYGSGRQIGDAIDIGGVVQRHSSEKPQNASKEWAGYDLAFLPGKALARAGNFQGKLYVVGTDGNQAMAFNLFANPGRVELQITGEYLPMQYFSGNGLFVSDGKLFYDARNQSIPLFSQHRPRYFKEAVVHFNTFDGKVFDCIWHRLLLDAQIPPGTRVVVESRAANDEEVIEKTDWRREPALYLRSQGSELPYHSSIPEDIRNKESAGTWELLLQQARGRFIQIRLTLTSKDSSSPMLYAMRIYYPRFSYLKEYLPAIYQADEVSASFLERFLANVEGIFTDMEGKIAEVQQLFDERSIDPVFLDWLASWFGIILNPGFDVEKRRLFLRHAIAMFEQRGTLRGLIRALRLALDAEPDDSLFEPGGINSDLAQIGEAANCQKGAGFGIRIIESYRSRNQSPLTLGNLIDDADREQEEDHLSASSLTRNAHHFTVMIPVKPAQPRTEVEKQLAMVRQIVEAEKPAHTVFDIRPYLAIFQAGHGRLGIDTTLGPGSRYAALQAEGTLGATYLTSRYPAKTVGRMITGKQ